MRNILVLGNGFDIYHGLQTQYSSFLSKVEEWQKRDDDLSEICCKNPFLNYFIRVKNADDKWIDCELEIENVARLFSRIFDQFAGKLPSLGIDISDYDGESLRIISCFKKYFPYEDGDSVLYIGEKYLSEGETIINKKNILSDLKKNLDETIDVLRTYLNEECDLQKINIYSPQIKQLGKIDYVITFNYTCLYKLYVRLGTSVFAPHGTLDVRDSMVLGMPDNDIGIDFIYFKKYFQRIQKHTGLMDPEIFLDDSNGRGNTSINSHIFGLSMGKTDEDFIRTIVDKSTTSWIYYYRQEDFENKIINLIDIYGREALEIMINQRKIVFLEIEEARYLPRSIE